jgi:hypothetical protein
LIDINKEYDLPFNLVQEANEDAIYLLTEGGYNGLALQALVAIQLAEPWMGVINERISREVRCMPLRVIK